MEASFQATTMMEMHVEDGMMTQHLAHKTPPRVPPKPTSKSPPSFVSKVAGGRQQSPSPVRHVKGPTPTPVRYDQYHCISLHDNSPRWLPESVKTVGLIRNSLHPDKCFVQGLVHTADKSVLYFKSDFQHCNLQVIRSDWSLVCTVLSAWVAVVTTSVSAGVLVQHGSMTNEKMETHQLAIQTFALSSWGAELCRTRQAQLNRPMNVRMFCAADMASHSVQWEVWHRTQSKDC